MLTQKMILVLQYGWVVTMIAAADEDGSELILG